MDALKFLLEWMRNPGRTAAILPSGKALAQLMTAGLSSATGRVIELGGGTGVFTKAILARGVAPENLTVIEINPEFAEHLRRSFPGVRIMEIGAETLIENLPPETAPVGAVVSGLPIIGIPWEIQKRILAGAFHFLGSDGAFVQFTYGPKLPIPAQRLAELSLTVKHMGFALGNVPPANVYRFSRVHSELSP